MLKELIYIAVRIALKKDLRGFVLSNVPSVQGY